MIYFDNAASTRALPEVAERFTEILLNTYANPSSGSRLGMEAEHVIKESAQTLARIINAQSHEEIIFTSGGTESNNIAVFGTAKGYYRSGKHIITTQIEHPAISLPFKALEEEGYEVQFLPVDEKGYVNIDDLKNAIRSDTILVSTILINNEIGTVQDVETIGKAIKNANPNTLYHVDGVQAFGKYKIDVRKCNIDMLSASGHKFNAPKGLGFLYIKSGLKVKPIMFGGGQQKGMRAGTENAAGAAAIALAAEESYKNLTESTQKVMKIKKHLAEGILYGIEDTFINGEDIDKASPYVLNIAFKNLRSPVLLNALEDKGIFVSAGSACNSKKKVQSSVLGALGVEEDDIVGSVRFSFTRLNTIEEADICLEALKELVPMLRRFNRKR
ncbi:MAG: cysteine desulfurase family protein [Lachnospiraceae bacterium]|nr:cysteine desulfurase family protein [Lachnospiraceae bacterium]